MEMPFADMVATWSAMFMADSPCEELFWKVGHFAACFAASRQAFQKNPKRYGHYAENQDGEADTHDDDPHRQRHFSDSRASISATTADPAAETVSDSHGKFPQAPAVAGLVAKVP